MNPQENTRLKLTELFDSESTFELNTFDGNYSEPERTGIIIWNPKYKIGFQYIFSGYGNEMKKVHLYPYGGVGREGYQNKKFYKLPDQIRGKLFIDAMKKLPEVLREYFKNFGMIKTIVFWPNSKQLERIYTSKSSIERLRSEFGSDYDIEIYEKSDGISSSLPNDSVVMKLKNTEKPNNMDLQENIQRIKEVMGLNERLILGRNERVHISTNKIESINDIEQGKSVFGKPGGLWYGFGDEWIYFAKHGFDDDSNLSFKKKKYGYKIYPNMEKIIVLRTKDDVDNFVDRYLSRFPNNNNKYDIDWVKVSQDYSGIEIPTYNELGMRSWGDPYENGREDVKRYSWLYPWDVTSGCIWKSDGVSRMKEL